MTCSKTRRKQKKERHVTFWLNLGTLWLDMTLIFNVTLPDISKGFNMSSSCLNVN